MISKPHKLFGQISLIRILFAGYGPSPESFVINTDLRQTIIDMFIPSFPESDDPAIRQLLHDRICRSILSVICRINMSHASINKLFLFGKLWILEHSIFICDMLQLIVCSEKTV